jgi:TetR/AcrR family transcriptional regulator
LIEFIEHALMGLVNKITTDEKSGVRQVESMIAVLLAFAQKNRGMTRVLIGDALVNEDERLQARINQLNERLEAALKQGLRFGVSQKEIAEDVDIGAHANLLMSFVVGRWHLFAKSGFKRDPADMWAKQWRLLMEGVIA